jgi:hypothetical protein
VHSLANSRSIGPPWIGTGLRPTQPCIEALQHAHPFSTAHRRLVRSVPLFFLTEVTAPTCAVPLSSPFVGYHRSQVPLILFTAFPLPLHLLCSAMLIEAPHRATPPPSKAFDEHHGVAQLLLPWVELCPSYWLPWRAPQSKQPPFTVSSVGTSPRAADSGHSVVPFLPPQGPPRRPSPPRLVNRCYGPLVQAVTVVFLCLSTAAMEGSYQWAPQPHCPSNRLLPPPYCSLTYLGLTSSTGAAGLAGRRRRCHLGASCHVSAWELRPKVASPLSRARPEATVGSAQVHSGIFLFSFGIIQINSLNWFKLMKLIGTRIISIKL